MKKRGKKWVAVIIAVLCCASVIMVTSCNKKRNLLATVEIRVSGFIQTYLFDIYENGDVDITAEIDLEDKTTVSYKLSTPQTEEISTLIHEVIKNETGSRKALGYLPFITIISGEERINFIY